MSLGGLNFCTFNIFNFFSPNLSQILRTCMYTESGFMFIGDNYSSFLHFLFVATVPVHSARGLMSLGSVAECKPYLHIFVAQLSSF
jgi:hypothetical protein